MLLSDQERQIGFLHKLADKAKELPYPLKEHRRERALTKQVARNLVQVAQTQGFVEHPDGKERRYHVWLIHNSGQEFAVWIHYRSSQAWRAADAEVNVRDENIELESAQRQLEIWMTKRFASPSTAPFSSPNWDGSIKIGLNIRPEPFSDDWTELKRNDRFTFLNTILASRVNKERTSTEFARAQSQVQGTTIALSRGERF